MSNTDFKVPTPQYEPGNTAKFDDETLLNEWNKIFSNLIMTRAAFVSAKWGPYSSEGRARFGNACKQLQRNVINDDSWFLMVEKREAYVRHNESDSVILDYLPKDAVEVEEKVLHNTTVWKKVFEWKQKVDEWRKEQEILSKVNSSKKSNKTNRLF